MAVLRFVQTPGNEGGLRRPIGLFAVGADGPDKPLGKGDQQRRGDEEGFNPHIHKAGDRPRRIVRMNGAEQAMPRLCRLDGNRRRLGITDLPHHDNVRILPEDGTEAARECHPRLPVELDLPDVINPVFDGVLEGNQVRVRAIEFAQDRVEAGALAASRRSGA